MTTARMQYLVPRALHRAGALRSLHVDLAVPRVGSSRLAWSFIGSRAVNRVIEDVPTRRLRVHPGLFLLNRVAGRVPPSSHQRVVDAMIGRYRAIARRCDSPFVSGHQGAAVELFQGRDGCLLEQFAPSLATEARLTDEERERFPDWQEPVGRPPWDLPRMEHEWDSADVVWVPAAHLIDFAIEQGADGAKFRVVPYPISASHHNAQTRPCPPANRPLRVIFAGTLALLKGVQYIHGALDGPLRKHVDVDFYGPSMLTDQGMEKLAEVGSVHAPVPRSTLLDAFQQADLMVFPAFAEGSGLVTMEAASVGLPIVTVKGSGAPAAARFVEARSVEALRAGIEEVLDDRSALQQMSAELIAEAHRRTVERFFSDLAAVALPLVGGQGSPYRPTAYTRQQVQSSQDRR